MGWILLTNALLAAGVSTGVAVLVWKAGVMDVPGDRSMHTDPTPRGGAVGWLRRRAPYLRYWHGCLCRMAMRRGFWAGGADGRAGRLR